MLPDIKKVGGSFSATKTNIAPDKVIDDFKQGSVGDCWFLLSVKALSNSEQGKEIIKKTINPNEDGSTSIIFQGDKSHKVYKVSEDELINRTELSQGDADTRALEIAAEKYCIDHKQNFKDGNNYITAFDMLLSRDSIFETVGEGKDNETVCFQKGSLRTKQILIIDQQKNGPEIQQMLKKKSEKPDIVLVAVIDKNDATSTPFIKDHAYMVESVDYKNEKVVLIEPHDTTKRIPTDMDSFRKYFKHASMIPENNLENNLKLLSTWGKLTMTKLESKYIYGIEMATDYPDPQQ